MKNNPDAGGAEDKAREVLAQEVGANAGFRHRDTDAVRADRAIAAMLAFADMRLDEAAKVARDTYEDGGSAEDAAERILHLRARGKA